MLPSCAAGVLLDAKSTGKLNNSAQGRTLSPSAAPLIPCLRCTGGFLPSSSYKPPKASSAGPPYSHSTSSLPAQHPTGEGWEPAGDIRLQFQPPPAPREQDMFSYRAVVTQPTHSSSTHVTSVLSPTLCVKQSWMCKRNLMDTESCVRGKEPKHFCLHRLRGIVEHQIPRKSQALA